MSDLISRNALKEEIEREKELNPYYALFYDKIIAVIYNAPTVKPCDNCDLYFKAMTKEAELDKMPMISKKHKGGAE